MNVFMKLNTKRTLAGDLITEMTKQLLRIRPFANPGLALADSLGIYRHKMIQYEDRPVHFLMRTMHRNIFIEATLSKYSVFYSSYIDRFILFWSTKFYGNACLPPTPH